MISGYYSSFLFSLYCYRSPRLLCIFRFHFGRFYSCVWDALNPLFCLEGYSFWSACTFSFGPAFDSSPDFSKSIYKGKFDSPLLSMFRISSSASCSTKSTFMGCCCSVWITKSLPLVSGWMTVLSVCFSSSVIRECESASLCFSLSLPRLKSK